MLCSGEAAWSFGVFFKALEGEFGWTRSVVSSGYMALIVGLSISTYWAGKSADRREMRPVLLLSAALGGAAMVMCSQVHTPFQLAACLFLAGLGAGATVSVPPSLVQRWFLGRPHSALALALVMCGVGTGALVFAPLLNSVIQNYGWRFGFVVAGSAFFVLVGSSASVLCARDPEAPSEKERVRQSRQRLSEARTDRGTFLSRDFIAALIVALTATFAFQTLSVHLVAYATDKGVSSGASATALGLIGGLSIPGRLLAGVLSSRHGYRATVFLAMSGAALSLLWLPFVDSPLRLHIFVAVYGVCHGIRAVANLGFLGQVFGVRSLGQLIGTVMATAQLMGALAPYAAGYIFDRVGNYDMAFVALALLLGIGGVFALNGTGRAESLVKPG